MLVDADVTGSTRPPAPSHPGHPPANTHNAVHHSDDLSVTFSVALPSPPFPSLPLDYAIIHSFGVLLALQHATGSRERIVEAERGRRAEQSLSTPFSRTGLRAVRSPGTYDEHAAVGWHVVEKGPEPAAPPLAAVSGRGPYLRARFLPPSGRNSAPSGVEYWGVSVHCT